MKYVTKTPIKLDSAVIPVGTMLDLPPDQAAELLALDAIEPVHKPFSAKLNPILKEAGNV